MAEHQVPAWQWLERLASREISAVELLALFQGRVERLNGKLNAVVLSDFDRAHAQAVEADARRARGEQAPLLGLPHTVKDCIYVAGFPTTGGLPERRHADASAESPLAERLRLAGSIVFGKTNVPPYAADWQSDNPLFGRTLNPWSDAVSPGGSSGGSAVAVASGMSPIEFGGDLAGSIRVPAAFCGVFGLKTSEHLLPSAGHFPGAPRLSNPAMGMGVQGPIGSCAKDLALALEVLSQAPGQARRSAPAASSSQRTLADYRICVLPTPDWLPVSQEVQAGFDAFCEKLRGAGAVVSRGAPSEFADLRGFVWTYRALLSAIEHAALPPALRQQAADDMRQAGGIDPFADATIAGALASAGDYLAWSGKRAFYADALRRFFGKFDVVLTPTQIVPPFAHTREQPAIARRLHIDGREVAYGLMFALPCLATFTGVPAVAFPTGLTASGLPLSCQALGPMFSDAALLAFVAALEETLGVQALVPPG
jgi:amidase